ncbi:TonB-dependent receptor [Puteibacter caeruleilacunae]|nr:TonB-dependent receptor [Puteibacter caeruleilacunae]
MLKKYIIWCVLVVFGCVNGYAQTTNIKGKVTDEAGEPLVGVNIIIVSDNNRFINGTVTDFDGSYSLQYNKEYQTIRYSFIGYKGQTLKINGRPIINVTLADDKQQIEEVVVSGSKQSNSGVFEIAFKDLTTANQRFEMSEISSVGAGTLGDALQGQLTSVDMVSSSGAPGSGMSIRIRGTSSLNTSQEPLIVLDGVIYPTDIQDDFDFQTADQNDYGALVDIAPEDIESIEVLKDAGATALYGSKGANGVLVITTKRGKRGPTRFNFSYKMKSRFVEDPIPMLSGDDYIALMNDALWNSYLDSEGSPSYINMLNDFPELTGDPEYIYFDEYNQNTNWIDLISRNSISHDNNLSMSGGGEKARYRFSLGYLDDIGTTKGTDYSRLNTRMNIDYYLSDKIIFSTDFSYTIGERNTTAVSEGSLRKLAFYKMPNMSPYQIDEEGNMTDKYFTPLKTFQGSTINPVAVVNEGYSTTESRKVRSVFRLNYQIAKGLSLKSSIAFDKNITKGNSFLPSIASGKNYLSSSANEARESNNESLSTQTSNRLTYRPGLGEKHMLTSMLLLQTSNHDSYAYSNKVGNTGSSELTNPGAGGYIASMGNGTTRRRDMGVLLNAHYAYDERYIVSFGVRMDGSSKFGSSKRFGYFPNVSLAYRISNEEFLKDIPWISDIKLRASYGEVGKAPAQSYPQYGTYKNDGTYMNHNAVTANSMTLDNLKWEEVKSTNVGIDAFLLNHKLNVVFDYYTRKTVDELQKNVKLPTTTGFSTIAWMNYGDVENEGFEFSGFWKAINKKSLKLQVNWNLSRNINKRLRLPDNVAYDNYSYANGKYASRVEIGKAIGSIYGYRSLGVYVDDDAAIAKNRAGNDLYNPEGELVYMSDAKGNTFKGGDAIYQDINFDGVIDENDIVYLGNTTPIVTGGMGPRLTYKNFSLNAFFHFRVGQKVINDTRIATENMRGRDNQSTAVLARWRKPGDVTEIPRALYGRGYNYLGSDRFVENGSYVRLKSLTLSYRAPAKFCKSLHLKQLTGYITGYDLITWTKYSGQDPEVGMNGHDNATTPRPRMINVGININL